MPKTNTKSATKSTYDAAKDVTVAVIGYIRLSQNLAIEVSLRSYDGADPKVAVLKVGKRKEDGSRRENGKLGRLTAEQAGKLALLLSMANERATSADEAEASLDEVDPEVADQANVDAAEQKAA